MKIKSNEIYQKLWLFHQIDELPYFVVFTTSDYIVIIEICRDSFPPSRRGSHAYGILNIFTQLTRELMNSVCPVMVLQKATSAMTLHCSENLQSGVTREVRTRTVNTAVHGGIINRWPHQKTSTLDDVIARNST